MMMNFMNHADKYFLSFVSKNNTSTNFKSTSFATNASRFKSPKNKLTGTFDFSSNSKKRGQTKSPSGNRKEWNKIGKSANFNNQTQQLQSLQELRDNKK